MSHVADINELQVSMSRVTRINKSWHKYVWVMPHIRMSHATHMNEVTSRV